MDHSRGERICDNLSTAVLLLDTDLAIRHVNPAGESLLETSMLHAQGIPIGNYLTAEHDLDRQLRQALETNHPFTEREVELTLPGGQMLVVDMTVTPLIERNRPASLLLEMIRVDRHLRITREERLMSQHLASRQLVRSLAHEIKNPLGGLRGAAQLLQREVKEPELEQFTRVIIGEADRLQALVDRLLGPNSLPRHETVNLHEVLEHVRRLVWVELPPGVHMRRDYDPSIPEFGGDRDQLIQAVLNLVRNAVQAVGDRGEIHIVTRVLRKYTIGHQLHRLVAHIAVIDDGPGIEDAIRDSIFLPMVTSRAMGTGLGLPIAQSLINQHGGLIECQSRPGRTEFAILLPLEDEDEHSRQGLDRR
jgi:two-component system nitrogen regulation sensor histidine kinase GlnL